MSQLEPRAIADLYERFRDAGSDPWHPPLDKTFHDRDCLITTLRALSVLDARHVATRTQVTAAVTSLSTELGARRIASVLDELLSGTKHELVVVGYDVSDRDVLRRLAELTLRGVAVDLLLDSKQTSLDDIRRTWPASVGVARVWATPQVGTRRRLRLHAKVVISDGRKALVGSANLTRSGLRSNIEIGVLLEGPVVRDLRAYAADLIARRVLVPATAVGGPVTQK